MSEPRFVAGALLRRSVRRQLLTAGIAFQEERGLLDSLFILPDASAEQLRAVRQWLERVSEED